MRQPGCADSAEASADMRILAVVSFFPLPENHGDALRRMMLLDALALMGKLHVLAVLRDSTTPEDVVALRSRLEGHLVEVFRPDRSRNLDKLMFALRTGAPPWMGRQWSAELDARIKSLSSDTYDAALWIGEPSGLYARGDLAARSLWDKSNVLSASTRASAREARGTLRYFERLANFRLSRAFEMRTLANIDEVWVTSGPEADRLEQETGRQASAVVRSMIKLEPHRANTNSSSRDLVWMSTLSYQPNWTGLLRLLDAADDLLVSRGYTLRVVGGGASAAQIEKLSTYRSVKFLGFVEDLAEAFDGVRCALVPVWSGAGVKLKTLTFTSWGVPIAATSTAIEGLPAEIAAYVSDDARDLVLNALTMTSEELDNAAVRASAIVESELGYESFARDVEQALDRTYVDERGRES